MRVVRTFSSFGSVACQCHRTGSGFIRRVASRSGDLSVSCQTVRLTNSSHSGQRHFIFGPDQTDSVQETLLCSRETADTIFEDNDLCDLDLFASLCNQQATGYSQKTSTELQAQQVQNQRGKYPQLGADATTHVNKKGLCSRTTHLFSHNRSAIHRHLLLRNLSTIRTGALIHPDTLRRGLDSDSLEANNTGQTKEPKTKSNKKIDIQKIMAEDDQWLTAGKHRIHAWSVSGMESCIVAQIEGTDIVFDMGYATRPSIKCGHVFISHGHIDHVAAIVKHAAHRSLYSLAPAVYYVPPHLEEPLRRLGAAYSELHGGDEDFCDLKIKPISPGETIQISKTTSVKAFPTIHRVPSQGYLVYRTRRALKSEYVGLPGPEIGKLVKEGVQVHDFQTLPELAYTGDTTFDVFLNPPTPDLLKVSTLITEATYIDDEVDRQGRGGVERAADRGHCHLQQLVDNQGLFEQVQKIVLVHFSDKYSVRYVRRKTAELLTEGLKEKVLLGIHMKQTLG